MIRLANLFMVYSCRLINLTFSNVSLLIDCFTDVKETLWRFWLKLIIRGWQWVVYWFLTLEISVSLPRWTSIYTLPRRYYCFWLSFLLWHTLFNLRFMLGTPLIHLSDCLHCILERFKLHKMFLIFMEWGISIFFKCFLRKLIRKHVRFLGVTFWEGWS